jgi:hypothetical protein
MFTWFKNLFKSKIVSIEPAPAPMAPPDAIVVSVVESITTEEKNIQRRAATDKLVAKKAATKKTAAKRPYVKKVK